MATYRAVGALPFDRGYRSMATYPSVGAAYRPMAFARAVLNFASLSISAWTGSTTC